MDHVASQLVEQAGSWLLAQSSISVQTSPVPLALPSVDAQRCLIISLEGLVHCAYACISMYMLQILSEQDVQFKLFLLNLSQIYLGQERSA